MRKKGLISLLFIMPFCLLGCGKKASSEEATVYINEYKKMEYETVAVERGDITPTLTLQVESDTFERKNYYPPMDEMEVDKVYVKEGDMVEAGDVMITFKSGDISEQIKSYQDRVKENQLLIDHYTNLMTIDSTLDYTADIEMLKEDMGVYNLYIQELNAKLESYNVVASGTGTVTMVSDLLAYGTVNMSDNILTIIYGTGDYYATTTEDFDFQVGEVYIATYALAQYNLELVDVEELEKDGSKEKRLHFTMAMEGITGVEKMNMVIEKPVMNNVLYLPKEAIFDVDDVHYVYVLDENGYREAIEIEVGQNVDGLVIVEKGLNEGDKVVIN